MEISVIIPVYNAEFFVRKATLSALQQPEVGEVLIIEDASTDNSLRACIKLEKEYPKVRLIRHPDGKNHGAGATRNLGIRNAKCDYVAFLDADDFYLQKRFRLPNELFKKNPQIDGVYEAVGIHFYDECGKKNWDSQNCHKLTTLWERLESKDLFEALIKYGKGSLHLDGIVIKKSLFRKCGYFYEHLKMHQDSTLIIQMAECGKLIPGRLNKPVAMRGVHRNNRILTNENPVETKCLARKTLFYWGLEKKIKKKKIIYLFHNYLLYLYYLTKSNKKKLIFKENSVSVIFNEIKNHPLLFLGAIIDHFSRKYQHKLNG